MATVSGVVLTGTIGAGKTTIAEAMSEQLHAAGIRHALLDLDWLGQVYPPPDQADPFNDSLAFKNLAAIWPNFLSAGISHVVLAATVTGRTFLDRIEEAMAAAELEVVRIVASPATIAERLRARDHGALLEDFLARTDALAGEIERAQLERFSVTNEDGRRDEVAAEVLRRLGWL